MKRRVWDTSCAHTCEKVHRPRVEENTDLVVREAKLLALTNELPHCLNEDCDGARAYEHFRIQFDIQLTW